MSNDTTTTTENVAQTESKSKSSRKGQGSQNIVLTKDQWAELMGKIDAQTKEIENLKSNAAVGKPRKSRADLTAKKQAFYQATAEAKGISVDEVKDAFKKAHENAKGKSGNEYKQLHNDKLQEILGVSYYEVS